MKQIKIPGIMGGMGPGATRDLYNLIIKNTPASTDQEHLEILIHAYPHLDRTAAILGEGESPLPTLISSAQKLKNAGADFLAIPCNTAHYFIPEIKNAAEIEILDMIETTGKKIEEKGHKKAGLLATTGTIKSQLYQNKISIEVIIPSNSNQEKVMEAIYGKRGVKAGIQYEKSQHNKNLLQEAISQLKDKGAEVVILGCTELPLCITQVDTQIPLINPTEILAKAIVEKSTS